MITRLPITKARVHLGQVVKRVHLGKEYFVLEKDGFPVAGLINIDEFEDFLEMKDPKVMKQISNGFREYHSGKSRSLEKILVQINSHSKKRKKR